MYVFFSPKDSSLSLFLFACLFLSVRLMFSVFLGAANVICLFGVFIFFLIRGSLPLLHS